MPNDYDHEGCQDDAEDEDALDTYDDDRPRRCPICGVTGDHKPSCPDHTEPEDEVALV